MSVVIGAAVADRWSETGFRLCANSRPLDNRTTCIEHDRATDVFASVVRSRVPIGLSSASCHRINERNTLCCSDRS